MTLTRYDGTRLLTEADVDREFLGQSVLLDCREFSSGFEGYLVASTNADRDGFRLLLDVKTSELNGHGLIVTGSNCRGEMILWFYD